MRLNPIGFVVGLNAEARLLRHTGALVEIGGGTPAGAGLAAERLIAQNARAIISFGLAGGLDPVWRPGDILLPRRVFEDRTFYPCDQKLLDTLGGANCETIMAWHRIAETALEKQTLFKQTGAAAIDLESGAVARVATAANTPFAALRGIADPAERNLPPLALIALNSAGNIRLGAVLASVAKNPAQIPALLAIGKDAAAARAALVKASKQFFF